LAEDSYDEYGHIRLGGIANVVADEIETRTGYETRVTILGYTQRGGVPTAYDRVLSSWYGVAAIDAVHDGAWGDMVALVANEMIRVPIADAVAELKYVNAGLWETAKEFFA
jgi:6-phosphofructokinase 1